MVGEWTAGVPVWLGFWFKVDHVVLLWDLLSMEARFAFEHYTWICLGRTVLCVSMVLFDPLCYDPCDPLQWHSQNCAFFCQVHASRILCGEPAFCRRGVHVEDMQKSSPYTPNVVRISQQFTQTFGSPQRGLVLRA